MKGWSVYLTSLDQALNKRLGKTIYTVEGKPLLVAGTLLTQRYIRALKRKGYDSVYVWNELAPDVQVDDAVNEITRIRATSMIAQTFKEVSESRPVDFQKVSDVVNEIIDDLNSNSDTLFSLSTIRCVDDYTFVHCVNVCILSLLIGSATITMKRDLKKLGVGAILHDLGKVKLKPEILRKPGKLSQEEFAEVQLHTVYGYEILREFPECSILSAHVAYQHHERMDGSGYPRGLKGFDIHKFARITAIADVYDAMASKRVYRDATSAQMAMQYLMEEGKGLFEESLVRRLAERIAIYPSGSIVRLDTGYIGVVVRQNSSDPRRPVVRILANETYDLIEPDEIDLSCNPKHYITTVFPTLPNKIKEKMGKSAASDPP